MTKIMSEEEEKRKWEEIKREYISGTSLKTLSQKYKTSLVEIETGKNTGDWFSEINKEQFIQRLYRLLGLEIRFLEELDSVLEPKVCETKLKHLTSLVQSLKVLISVEASMKTESNTENRERRQNKRTMGWGNQGRQRENMDISVRREGVKSVLKYKKNLGKEKTEESIEKLWAGNKNEEEPPHQKGRNNQKNQNDMMEKNREEQNVRVLGSEKNWEDQKEEGSWTDHTILDDWENAEEERFRAEQQDLRNRLEQRLARLREHAGSKKLS